MLVTFIKKEISKSKKIINIVSFIIIQTIFCLVLTVIQVNDINIYEENALYGNSDVLTLMQLLMGTFAIQIITLLVIYIIDKITYRLDVKEGKVAHITHAKVKPEIVIEYKEPEVKLPKSKPVKPLNKKLIEKSKIEPISLNEMINKEIIQEKLLKPEPELPKVQAEALYIPKKEKVVPTIPKVKTETLNVDKPTKKPDLLKPEVIKEVPKQKVKWVPGPRPEVTTKVTKEKGPLTFTEFKPEFPDSEIKKTSMAPTINENAKYLKLDNNDSFITGIKTLILGEKKLLELFKGNKMYLITIFHELAHIKEFNHSSKFYDIVEKYCPNYKELRKKLKGR